MLAEEGGRGRGEGKGILFWENFRNWLPEGCREYTFDQGMGGREGRREERREGGREGGGKEGREGGKGGGREELFREMLGNSNHRGVLSSVQPALRMTRATYCPKPGAAPPLPNTLPTGERTSVSRTNTNLYQ